jgi:deoxycytidine triphosphate deaminase
MASSEDNLRTRRERERERLLELRARLPKDGEDYPFTGVLLNDAIKRCCDDFGLITPLCEKNLKPANYKLRIGDEYAIGGRIFPLSDAPGNNEIRVEPFEVAIIKTLETINMPPFLIGRWNIQVSKAYKGLLWVGGPQVDAGYVGHLFCPIYNLSDRPVVLHYADPIAVIDFEKTTEFHDGRSIPYGFPGRILFEDYEPDGLQSALTGAKERITTYETELKSLTTRIDTFVTITFTLLGILFAAGALFVTQSGHAHWWDPSIFWVCTLAVLLSGWAFVRSRSDTRGFPRALAVAAWILLLALIGAGYARSQRLETRLDDLKGEVQRLGVPAHPQVPSPGPGARTNQPPPTGPAHAAASPPAR